MRASCARGGRQSIVRGAGVTVSVRAEVADEYCDFGTNRNRNTGTSGAVMKKSHVPVLVVGAGAAGTMLTLELAPRRRCADDRSAAESR